MPAMGSTYVWSILKKQGHLVDYCRFTKNKSPNLDNYDFAIIPSSIIAHETEVELAKLISDKGIKTFVIGIFANISIN